MSQIVSVHSFRGGTGKSNMTANVAAVLVQQGLRVGVVDTDIQSPGIHTLFGVKTNTAVGDANPEHAGVVLNDFLYGRCNIEDAALDVTAKVMATQLGKPLSAKPATGKLYFIPASIRANDIARVLREGFDPELLSDGLRAVVERLSLDLLIVDTHPGINEQTLLSVAISDKLLIILRPDRQDYQGTAVTLEVAQRLGVPEMFLVLNKVPSSLDPRMVRLEAEKTFNCDVISVIPHSDDLMVLGSSDMFVLHQPDHPVSVQIRKLASTLCG